MVAVIARLLRGQETPNNRDEGGCLMEFLRKTVVSLVLVFGGLFTVHSLGTLAIKTFVTSGAAVPLASQQTATVALASDSPVSALEAKPMTPPASADNSKSTQGSDTTKTVWAQLASQAYAAFSELFGNLLIEVTLALIGGGALGGAAVYKLYPSIQRIKTSRRIKAAQRRKLRVAEDEKLLTAV